MFVEHVLLPHSDVDVIVKFGRRLDVVSYCYFSSACA